jgi:hypothetical protein
MRKIGINHFKIILIENFKCDNKEQLNAREEYWRKKLKATLNMNKCNISRSDLKEYSKQYHKMYRKNKLTHKSTKPKRMIKATGEDKIDVRYYDSVYACSQLLKINAGLIKYACEGKNRVYGGKSKINNKYYTFAYITEAPKDSMLSMPKDKLFRKNKFHCDICGRDIMTCRQKTHNDTDQHKMNEKTFIDREFNKILELEKERKQFQVINFA